MSKRDSKDRGRKGGSDSRDAAEWMDYRELQKQEETGKKTYEIYMRQPVINKTSGVTDDKWREIAARFDDSNEWHPDRVLLHESIISTLLQDADTLSRRLRRCESEKEQGPTIYCLRGACGSGKTTTLRSGIIDGVLDEDGKANGVLAPDVLKMWLRKNTKLSHIQVHDEASMLGRRLSGILYERAMLEPYSVVYNKSMAYVTDFEDVFRDASETGRKVVIFDIDVPLELSAVRVLARKKGGEDSNIDFDGVVSAFLAIRKNRPVLFNQIMENQDLLSIYVLKAFDPKVKHLVDIMVFNDGEMRTMPNCDELARIAVASDNDSINAEINKIGNTLITEEYVSYYQNKYLDGESEWNDAELIAELRRNAGKTISEALDEKSKFYGS